MRTIRPGDGTPAGVALDLHNTLVRHARGATVTVRTWFGPFPAEVEILDEADEQLDDPQDIVALEGGRPDGTEALARALAADLPDGQE